MSYTTKWCLAVFIVLVGLRCCTYTAKAADLKNWGTTIGNVKTQADTSYGYGALQLTRGSEYKHLFTITGEHGAIVILNMDTGRATLHGNPNDAARVFWKIVERMRPEPCK